MTDCINMEGRAVAKRFKQMGVGYQIQKGRGLWVWSSQTIQLHVILELRHIFTVTRILLENMLYFNKNKFVLVF
jgi:hypothetical protein